MAPGASDDWDELEITPRVMWALANESTRLVILQLLESADRDVSLEELAEHVSRHHTGSLRSAPNRAKVRLHHMSLPQLDEFGLIEYDPDACVVRNRWLHRIPASLLDHLRNLNDD